MKLLRGIAIAGLVLIAVFAVCGDKICESHEYKNCRDCAMTQPNFACDSYPDAQTSRDPDCENIGGCYGPQSDMYLYSNGRGASCWPGKCSGGSCDSTCTANSDCTSGFCINGSCNALCLQDPKETALNCTQSGAYTITPLKSTIYTGTPTYVVFNISGSGSATVQARGPCDLEYPTTVDLTFSSAPVIVEISNCSFTGVSSIRLNTSDSSGVVHFLSFPTLRYSTGEIPARTVGQISLANRMAGSPVEVTVWVG